MTNAQKWTVRNIEPQALAMLHEVRETSGVPLGQLLTEAVTDWYRRLPEDQEDDADLDQAGPGRLEELIRVLMNR